MFADDTCIFTKSSSTYESAKVLNEDLSNIETWASQWLVKFSPAKTESMFISLQTHKACNLPRLVDALFYMRTGMGCISDRHGYVLTVAWPQYVQPVLM